LLIHERGFPQNNSKSNVLTSEDNQQESSVVNQLQYIVQRFWSIRVHFDKDNVLIKEHTERESDTHKHRKTRKKTGVPNGGMSIEIEVSLGRCRGFTLGEKTAEFYSDNVGRRGQTKLYQRQAAVTPPVGIHQRM